MGMALALAAVRVVPTVMRPPCAGLCQVVPLGIAVAFAVVMQAECDGFLV